MKQMKQILIIFSFTMVGELLNKSLPLPVPAGVYGLFLLLIGLSTKWIRLEDVERSGNFLLDSMPIMFIPVSVGLLESYQEMKEVALPLIVISVVSTIVVMIVTGRVAQAIIKKSPSKAERGR